MSKKKPAPAKTPVVEAANTAIGGTNTETTNAAPQGTETPQAGETKPDAGTTKTPEILWNGSADPTESGVFQIDRGPAGKPARYFNAETGKWSQCADTLAEALAKKDVPSAIGFFPWRGPFQVTDTVDALSGGIEITAPAKKVKPPVLTEDQKTAAKALKAAESAKAKADKAAAALKAKEAKVAEKAAAAKAAGAAPKPAAYPDGTIFYRADRQKWIAMAGGKQEAARPSVEACKNFLTKKYPALVSKIVVIGDPTQGAKQPAAAPVAKTPETAAA